MTLLSGPAVGVLFRVAPLHAFPSNVVNYVSTVLHRNYSAICVVIGFSYGYELAQERNCGSVEPVVWPANHKSLNVCKGLAA